MCTQVPCLFINLVFPSTRTSHCQNGWIQWNRSCDSLLPMIKLKHEIYRRLVGEKSSCGCRYPAPCRRGRAWDGVGRGGTLCMASAMSIRTRFHSVKFSKHIGRTRIPAIQYYTKHKTVVRYLVDSNGSIKFVEIFSIAEDTANYSDISLNM